MLARLAIALQLCLPLLLGFPGFVRGQADRVPTENLRFPSGGAAVRVERFAPPTGKVSRPAVVVLHGAGGMLFDGPEMRRVAGTLAAAGHPAYVVHYFNRTGTLAARTPILYKHYPDWLPTVRDAVAMVHEREGNGQPVGVYGYSLGAFLAMAVSGDNPRVGAVVEQAGGIWDNVESRLGRRVPPVLMVHGRDDQRVKFDKYAVPLQRFLRERNTVVETRFLAGEGHVYSAGAQAGVRAAAADFFGRRLRGNADLQGHNASRASIRPVRPRSIR